MQKSTDSKHNWEIIMIENNAVTAIVVALIQNNNVTIDRVPDLIRNVRLALESSLESKEPDLVPAVNPKQSVFPDYIICLEDSKKVKLLRCHLKTVYNMTPDEYRAKWGLPDHYPMVAPNYSRYRSKLSKQFGLGKKRQKGGGDVEHSRSIALKSGLGKKS